jgi:hypothetical protein
MKNAFIAACLLLMVLTARSAQDDRSSSAKGLYFGKKPPGAIPVPFAPDMIGNRFKYSRSLTFLPDGTEAYWAVVDVEHDLRRWIVESRIVNGKWTEPRQAPFSKLGWEDDVPCISPDGRKMFFISRRPIHREDRSKKENIWVMERLAGNWGEPKPLPPIVNSLTEIHHQLSVDRRGNLFFAAVQKSGFGEGDLYCSEFKNGGYQNPANLGPVINSSSNENTPFVAPDGSYLIFCRYNANGWSLFVSFWQDGNGWSVPEETSKYVTVPEGMNVDSPLVTRDGRYLIFFCDDGKSTAPYWVDAKTISGPKTKR